MREMPVLEDAVALRSLPAADRLPTLTEVVQLAQDPWAAAPPAPLQEICSSGPAEPGVPEAPSPAPVLDEDAIFRRVLFALDQRLDAAFEARLREALAPALARAADGLIRELRPELTQALHEMVHVAVSRAVQDAQPR